MTIKVFISYSHKDKKQKDELNKRLTVLRDNRVIETWHDEEIIPGTDWNEKIEQKMQEAHIILLLFSDNFIASDACKKEVALAQKRHNEEKTMFIPIILDDCAWKDMDGISKIEVLPKKGLPISEWRSKGKAWRSIYDGIKKAAQEIQGKIPPKPNHEFGKKLQSNFCSDGALSEIFVYPDLLTHDSDAEDVLDMTIDSEDLTDINGLPSKYVLIAGEEQIGKTSLCNMLYMSYLKKDLYPVMIHGRDIVGKADITSIVNKCLREQYQEDASGKYWKTDVAKRVLLIDDVHERKAKWENYASFIGALKEKFGCAIVFVDNLVNLSDNSVNHDRFSFFKSYSIEEFGHLKKNQLIKKHIENDVGEFDPKNEEHVKRLDRDTNHINSILGTKIVPSYPVFIVPSIAILETFNQPDMSKTSYGHCYHAMITMQLYRSGVKPDDMDAYLNFLKHLAYHMFKNNTKSLSNKKLEDFCVDYSAQHITDANLISSLENSNIIKKEGDKSSFGYVYIYYYFVAQCIADNISDDEMKQHIERLTGNIHKKDNANIIIFTAHHSQKTDLLEDILVNCLVTFDSHSEATLAKTETQFIIDLAARLEKLPFPPKHHDAMETRNKALRLKDKNQSAIDKAEETMENDDNEPVVSILKSAKSMDILGQIMKNQYGSFTKQKLRDMFEQAQNVGLRLLKSYIDIMNQGGEQLDEMLQGLLVQAAKKEGKELSDEEARARSRHFLANVSYFVIYGWLLRIVHSLGHEKLVGIANDVHKATEQGTVASKLINFSIHVWYTKKLNLDTIKSLAKEFRKDNHYVAMHMLQTIVAHYLHMHEIDDYDERQAMEDALMISAKKQLIKHREINQKKK